jgi:hypothetical protein
MKLAALDRSGSTWIHDFCKAGPAVGRVAFRAIDDLFGVPATRPDKSDSALIAFALSPTVETCGV